MIKEERTTFNSEINLFNNNRNNFVAINKETNRLRKEGLLRKLEEIKLIMLQRRIEKNRTRYTMSALSERIKKDLASVTFDINEYVNKIAEHKKKRLANQCYYDYDLELDFSVNPKIPFNIDDRWYYYKSYHYQKLGLFLRKDVPYFKVSLSHLSPDIIYELKDLDSIERKFVLKQAVSRIFEDINYDLFHDSISDRLEVVFVT